ncbi:hypothetical protein [Modestobacter sp. VKM Ac-2978]|uniref:hypothetical protein n=1 Tax=Modestobacter sp. VKM Ac-2978 TaxID=3004132 RepID=UPI0022AA9B34|nr:hypothetical protein [Modestobacter sp. VKM Ac-2978]
MTEAVADTSASKGMPVDKALAHREVEAAIEELAGLRRDPRLLWVDDHPNDKRHEIAAFEALGLTSIVTRGRGARPVHTAGSE